MSRTTRLALVASIVSAACIVGAGVVVLSSTHTASAEDRPVAAAADTRVERGTTDLARPSTPNQVVTGALDTPALADAVPFAYAGDSITARPDSWLHQLERDDRLHAVGGYAHSGYRADQVLAEVGPVPEARVLVVEVGTNDVNQAVPAERTIADVDAIVRKVGAERVLVVAGPPSDWTWSRWGADRRSGQLVLTDALHADADAHGWAFVDPFRSIRAADGAYVAGTSRDGIHPTAEANRGVARAMADAIERTAR
ncbi:SGNH/GDSL hydrolase family protein [Curtobacterium caseinilyticum]|uniref:SGNH/GDSL hydrolase family protein n=1 Tax=Curtobacterium caseinilyticum TaxID=3055137 RepID=A0ABT7TSQ8_9MICO|nr:SGNH/GDSL hydrolase family protein [Curtobacterium caseinilyticum]MDM7892645.1 SGNH/GDSL hydrolase family protein [Curtobacterium caseinilyticum]